MTYEIIKNIRHFHLRINEQNEKSPKKKIFRITETFLLAGIPFLAYGLMYIYESNYMDYFGIPAQYMNIDLAELMFFIMLVILIVMVLVILFCLISVILLLLNWPLPNLTTSLLISFALYGLITSYMNVGINLSLVIANLIIASLSILGIIILNNSKYFDKIKNLLESFKNARRERYINYIFNINQKLLYIFIVSSLLISIASSTGIYTAHMQSIFPVIKTNPECIVFYVKSDLFICSSDVNMQTREFEQGYQTYNLQDLKGIKIVWENIGSLHPKPIPTAGYVTSNIPAMPTSNAIHPLLTTTP